MNTDAMVTAVLAIVGGVIGLAVVSVLVSKQAQTPTVLSSAGSALSNVISAAVSPVTGQSVSPNVGSSSSDLFNGDFLSKGLSVLSHSFGS
jgi:hypothetical protein